MKRIALGLLSVGLLAIAMLGVSSAVFAEEAGMAKLDVNTATVEELQAIPDMDMELAQNIVAYRNINGPFASIDDLMKVKGMDETKMELCRMHLTVGAP